ncbi:MAG: hypothetical protein ACOC0P_00720 [Planctomycetota bacterium]
MVIIREYWQRQPGRWETGEVLPGPPMVVEDDPCIEDNAIAPGHPQSSFILRVPTLAQLMEEVGGDVGRLNPAEVRRSLEYAASVAVLDEIKKAGLHLTLIAEDGLVKLAFRPTSIFAWTEDRLKHGGPRHFIGS